MSRVALAGLLLLAGLPSCTVLKQDFGIRLPAPPAELGVTEGDSLQEVLDRMGPPSQVSAAGSGCAFLYETLAFTELQLGVEFPMVDWLKIAGGRATTDREVAILVFDAERRLSGLAHFIRSEGLGLGGGIQVFFQVEGVVDTDSIEDPFGIHDWARMLLDPLPRGLNREQNLDSGEHGFEILGTPRRVGQHTLEKP